MAVVEKEICCCGAYKWLQVFAWMEIVTSALLVLTIFSASGTELVGNDGLLVKTHPNGFTVSIPGTWFTLVECLSGVAIGIMLLQANKKEKLELLVAWGAYTVLNGIYYGALTLPKSPDVFNLVSGLLVYLALVGFPLYIVYRRVKEISASRGGKVFDIFV